MSTSKRGAPCSDWKSESFAILRMLCRGTGSCLCMPTRRGEPTGGGSAFSASGSAIELRQNCSIPGRAVDSRVARNSGIRSCDERWEPLRQSFGARITTAPSSFKPLIITRDGFIVDGPWPLGTGQTSRSVEPEAKQHKYCRAFVLMPGSIAETSDQWLVNRSESNSVRYSFESGKQTRICPVGFQSRVGYDISSCLQYLAFHVYSPFCEHLIDRKQHPGNVPVNMQ